MLPSIRFDKICNLRQQDSAMFVRAKLETFFSFYGNLEFFFKKMKFVRKIMLIELELCLCMVIATQPLQLLL